VDLAAAIAGMRHAQRPVVTASVDSLHFLAPVHIGELITLRASVNRVFRTSMEIGVKVTTEKLLTGEQTHTCSAYLTFVALDRDGRAVPIVPVIPETEEEKRRFEHAGERRAYRLATRDRLKTRPRY
jgi:acyl-CoA hydrolase